MYQDPDRIVAQQTEGEILKRTTNPPEEILWPYSQLIRNFDFAKSEFNCQTDSLENILYYCIWYTYFGKAHKKGAFQKIIIPNWYWYSTIKIRKIDLNKQLELYQKWWNGIEFHLNLAIFYNAVAINGLRKNFLLYK